MPQLPEAPLVLTSSFQVYIVPTEKHLFVQGFKPVEYEGVPPTLLRGCLVLRVMKATKIRSINLVFKGTQRTDWPEGIPPKKNIYSETNDIVSHTWPFYQMETPQRNCGADLFIPKSGHHEDISNLNLADLHVTTLNLAPVESAASFAASLIKRATSPIGGGLPSSNALTSSDSMADLTAVLSSLSIVSMGDSQRPGYFEPGDYIYNFEHPIPALSPETAQMSFGKVSYHLESTIVRIGAFKPNLVARLPVQVVRIPSDNSVEENEPIVIERDWEDQLRYEIVVGSKSVVLDSYVPLVFRFIPLYGKVALHRIRVYVTENSNYYCHNKAVHREEPVKKFLLLEHKAKKNKSLLSQNGGLTEGPQEGDDEVLPRELEFQLYVPSAINKKYNYFIHPDTAIENIKCEHWIKISLRISKKDPNNPEKRKHFEILIDSPIHLCSSLAAHCNTLLPAYDIEPEFLPKYTPNSPPVSPEVTAVDFSHHQSHLILAALSPFGGSGGDDKPSPPPRPTTPIDFQHISSPYMNDEPIERDFDVHLEANLYKPEESDVLEALTSPQAKPYTPVSSPHLQPVSLGSPVSSRAPSMAPPAFEESGPNTEDTLPPAYFKEDPAMSISPVRIDVSNETRSRRARTVPSITIHDPSLTGIKDILSKQLDKRERNSISDRESLHSTPSKKSLDSSEDKKSLNSKSKQNPHGGILESGSRINEHGEIPETVGKSQDGITNDFQDRESAEVPRVYSGPVDDTDIADIKAEGAPPVPSAPHLRVERTNGLSRHSSICLATLSTSDEPLDQTLPLLSLSTSSVHDGRQDLFDYERRLSILGSMSDIVDVTLFGHNDLNVHGSLFALRNPRIAKHYQDSSTEEVAPIDNESKPRQKSFGVIPLLGEFHGPTRSRNLTDSSGESDMTVSAIASSTGSKGDAFLEPVDLQEVASQ